MKKFRISIFILLLCSIVIFTGCTKANKATMTMVGDLYATTIKNYGKDSSTQKIKVFDEDSKRVDLYSSKAYSAELSNLIESKETTDETNDTSISTFNVLKQGGEYQVIVQGITDFFANKFYNDTSKDIPQSVRTKLYESIDSLSPILKNIVVQKNSLETTLQNFGVDNSNEVPVQESFKQYLKNYDKLVAQLYLVNKNYEELYTGYLNTPRTATKLNGGIPEGETARLVYSSELYLAEYYYQKHMILSSAYETRFTNKFIKQAGSSTAVLNTNYDDMFENFKQIVQKNNEVADPTTPTDDNAITYYNACLQKLETLKTDLKNYTTAVQKIVDYKNSHNGVIDSNSSAYHYVEFIESFDAEVLDYQNYLLHHIMKII